MKYHEEGGMAEKGFFTACPAFRLTAYSGQATIISCIPL
jgi:hypothetical protein